MKPTEPPPAPSPARSRGSPPTFWIVVLLVAYLLSPGPALRLGMSFQTSETVYAPLIYLVDHWPPAAKFYQWYIFDLCGVPLPVGPK